MFVVAASLGFLCSAAVILNLPLSYNVKSSIEIASTLVAGRLQLIEAPDQVAKRATDRYFPSALLKLEFARIEFFGTCEFAEPKS